MFYYRWKPILIFVTGLLLATLQACNIKSERFLKTKQSGNTSGIENQDESRKKNKIRLPEPVEENEQVKLILKEDLVDNPTYFQRAFDLLTPRGSEIFYNAKEFIKQQKQPNFQSYAQPLQCATNVSHVLNISGYNFTGAAVYAVPGLLKAVTDLGGKVYQLPLFDQNSRNKQNIIDYINSEFDGKIPTGALVAGCESIECEGAGASAHISIVGDKNSNNDLMLYHNNWLRPNNLKGQRVDHMVSLENFYDLERPREWMATPWLNFIRNAEGDVIDIISKSPMIDDLDPFNGKYYIKIAVLPEILTEIQTKNFLPHHKLVINSNPHNDIFAFESKREICRSKVPFRAIDARSAPGGAVQEKVYDELREYVAGETFYDYNFEFVITESSTDDMWAKIKTYDANIFWGSSTDSNNTFGEIWIKNDPNLFECFEKGSNY